MTNIETFILDGDLNSLYLFVCVRLRFFASLLVVLPLYIRSKVCAVGLIN